MKGFAGFEVMMVLFFIAVVGCAVLIRITAIETNTSETRALKLLEQQGQEKDSFIKEWESKENPTTQELEEFITEFKELNTTHQKELEELLDSIKVSGKRK